jgi:predicted DNA-binding protein with PD1-like motif
VNADRTAADGRTVPAGGFSAGAQGGTAMSVNDGGGFSKIERLYQLRLRPGTDLLEGITAALPAAGIRAGVFVSGLGALRRAVFRNLKVFPEAYPVRPADRLYLEVEAPMELVSLTGWVAPSAEGVEVHAHFAASTVKDETVVTMGGHLTRGTICGIKCVVALLVIDPDSVRADVDAGTKSLDLFWY